MTAAARLRLGGGFGGWLRRLAANISRLICFDRNIQFPMHMLPGNEWIIDEWAVDWNCNVPLYSNVQADGLYEVAHVLGGLCQHTGGWWLSCEACIRIMIYVAKEGIRYSCSTPPRTHAYLDDPRLKSAKMSRVTEGSLGVFFSTLRE